LHTTAETKNLWTRLSGIRFEGGGQEIRKNVGINGFRGGAEILLPGGSKLGTQKAACNPEGARGAGGVTPGDRKYGKQKLVLS